MEKIIVAVGSTRKPKVEAVNDALGVVGPFLGTKATFEIAAVEVPSGVRDTPLSREDLMTGARQRASAPKPSSALPTSAMRPGNTLSGSKAGSM